MGSEAAYDVFISYARSDGAGAAELNGWLRAQGLRTFFDLDELNPGLRWIPALEDAIRRSAAVAILVGEHGIGNTQQYEREFAFTRQASDHDFPVIPVLMPGCNNPPTGFLQLVTWVDLSQGRGLLQQPDSLASLLRAIHRERVSPPAIRAQVCPYRGLEPFHEEDAAFFCGRDDAIKKLVDQVAVHSFVAVVGPSGSGKSSLVFAGLLPALRQQRQTIMWDVVTFRPGASPLLALAEAFEAAPEGAGLAVTDAYWEAQAAAYRNGKSEMLLRIIDRRMNAAPERPDRLLIYVDQWEELYAMAPRPEDRDRRQQHAEDVEKFIALLVAAASGERSRARVVLTARADFYASLMRSPLLSALLPAQQVNIKPMNRSDLRSAIETPAKNAGLSFAPPALVDQILADVGTEEGRLPLLQFALKETWRARKGDQLTAEAYTTVGGVTGAIEKTAEDAYNRLQPKQQEAARSLFLRLVTPGEGHQDTRARSLIPDDRQQREIIDLFSNPKTRLLVTGAPQGAAQAEGATNATVEVAHEALIQRWSTLQKWVGDNREKLRTRAAILRAKEEWEKHGQNEDYLLAPGVQLESARALIEKPGDVPVDDVRVYVDRSIAKDNRGKRLTLSLWIVVGLVLAAITVYAYRAKGQAEEQLSLARETLNVQVRAVTEDLQNDVGIQNKTLIRLLDKTESSFERLLDHLKDDPRFGGDRAEMLHDYGVAYIKNGKTDEAESRFRDSLEQFRALFGNDPTKLEWRRGVAEQLDQLGLIYKKQNGKNDLARQTFGESLRLREEIAKDHPEDWKAYRDLSSIQYDLGEYLMSNSGSQDDRQREALERFRKAQEYVEKALGLVENGAQGLEEIKWRKARILVSMGEAYPPAQKELKKIAFEEALKIRQDLYASNQDNKEIRRDLSYIYFFLGNQASENGDLRVAAEHYDKSYKLRNEAYTTDPSDNRAKSDLAWVALSYGKLLRLQDQKDHPDHYERAREQLEIASKLMFEVSHQDDHNDVRFKDSAMAQQSLGDLEMDLLNSKAALSAYISASDILENITNKSPNPQYIKLLPDIYDSTGEAWLLDGDSSKATEAFDKGLKLRRPSYAQQPDGVALQTALAQAYCSLGELQAKRDQGSPWRTSYRNCQTKASGLATNEAKRLLDQATKALNELPEGAVAHTTKEKSKIIKK